MQRLTMLLLKALSFQGIDINVYNLKTDYYELWFLYKGELRISKAG